MHYVMYILYCLLIWSIVSFNMRARLCLKKKIFVRFMLYILHKESEGGAPTSYHTERGRKRQGSSKERKTKGV